MGLEGVAKWLPWRSDPSPGSRVLVLWWGSIKRGQITAGDYMAAGNVALGLQARGLTVEIAAFHPFPVPGVTVVHPRNAAATRYRVAIFVCGPIRTARTAAWSLS